MIGVLRRSPYRTLEKALGYRFRNLELLETALIHRSFRFESQDEQRDNQRLEFLGDAVLGLLTAQYVYGKYDDKDEGVLTAVRSQATSGKAFASIARSIGLGDFVRMGKGEDRSGGRRRTSTLADAFEAVVGAAYLDGGLKAADKVFLKVMVPVLDGLSGDIWADNPKGKLQEYCQRILHRGPRYRVARMDGPPHAVIFTVEVFVDSERYGTGRGPNKQEAETQAAMNALIRFDEMRRGRHPARGRVHGGSWRHEGGIDDGGNG